MNIQKLVVPSMVGLGVVAGVAGGSALNAVSANAESATTSTSTTASGTSTSTTSTSSATKGPHAANGITETALTGDSLSKATAAAKAAVSGGTVIRAETDADGAKYEVHMQKSDGTTVTVKLDANYKVTSVEGGMA
jgi:hypothetical protein